MDSENFVVQLAAHPLGGYDIRVVESPVGRARTRCLQPLAVNYQDGLVSVGRDLGLTPTESSSNSNCLSPQAFGDQLFRTLFSGDVKEALAQSVELVTQRDCVLRLQLRIELPTLAQLIDLPWELMYNAELEEFVCLNRRTLFARVLKVPRPQRPAVLSADLRVLAVAGAIDAPEYAPLALGDELLKLAAAARQAGIHFEVLMDARRAPLAAALEHGRFHVLHFLGHGWFDPASGRGGLCFKAPDGTAELVEGGDLAIELKGLRDLQLVFLNACSTGRITTDGARQSPFAGAASALILGGIPAVIAMRESIGDRPAIDFSVAFYQNLLAGLSIEEAIRQGRLALQREGLREVAEWAIPMLFLEGRSVPMGATDESAGASAGWVRNLLDRAVPLCHQFLTHRGWLPAPAPDIRRYLAQLRTEIESALRGKSYLPGQARTVPSSMTDHGGDAAGPLDRRITASIRQLGRTNSAAEVVATATAEGPGKSRQVRNLIQLLLRSRTLLVLLGDPGSGKTMALQEAMLELIQRESRRLFPSVPIYIRLGEFHVDGQADSNSVRELIRQSTAPLIRPFLAELERDCRLILFFDGMDEMSRDQYGEHVLALNQFAGENREHMRMLFTCRIDDFSTAFNHRRLVLLPFGPDEIARYLRRHLNVPSLLIDGRSWTADELAKYLAENEVAVDASNPFILSLLCDHLYFEKTWPATRVALYASFHDRNYQRKNREAQQQWRDLPSATACFAAWAHFAYVISERDRGDVVAVQVLAEQLNGGVLQTIYAGLWCGTLAAAGVEQLEGQPEQIRFGHRRDQEYFTALWIHQARPEIAWREKLASPPWQEAMLNLALMGEGDAGVDALAGLIAYELHGVADVATGDDSRSASTHSAEESVAPPASFADGWVPYERESSLAELVDLGARLLQAAPAAPAVRPVLRPVLAEALDLLADRGRPVTQLRMMRACRRLDDIEVGRTLNRLVGSPVRLVSDMALILVNGARAGRGVGGTDLATAFAFTLAASRILDRWPVLKRAARSAGRHRNQVYLAWVTAFALLELALVLLLAAGLFNVVVAALHRLDRWASHPSILVGLHLSSVPKLAIFQCMVTGTVILVAIRRYSSSAPAYALLSVPVGIVLLAGCLSVIHGAWTAVLLMIVVLFGAHLSEPVVEILYAPAHLLVVRLYARLPRRLRPFLCSRRALFRLTATELDLAVAALKKDMEFWICVSVGTLPLLGIFAAMALVFSLPRLLSWCFGLPFSALVNVISLGLLLGLILVVSVIRSRDSLASIIRALLPDALQKTIAAIPGLLAVYLLLRYTHESGLAIVYGASLAALFLVVRSLGHRILLRRASRHKRPPGEESPDEWIEHLSKASPDEQMRLLAATTPTSFGQSLEAFAHLLEQVEFEVRSEPALSFYWQLRYQIAQALRQERIS